jgi:hypothetical protein
MSSIKCRLDLDQAARRKARDDKFLGTLHKESHLQTVTHLSFRLLPISATDCYPSQLQTLPISVSDGYPSQLQTVTHLSFRLLPISVSDGYPSQFQTVTHLSYRRLPITDVRLCNFSCIEFWIIWLSNFPIFAH